MALSAANTPATTVAEEPTPRATGTAPCTRYLKEKPVICAASPKASAAESAISWAGVSLSVSGTADQALALESCSVEGLRRETVTRLKMASAMARQSKPAPQLAELPGKRTVTLCSKAGGWHELSARTLMRDALRRLQRPELKGSGDISRRRYFSASLRCVEDGLKRLRALNESRPAAVPPPPCDSECIPIGMRVGAGARGEHDRNPSLDAASAQSLLRYCFICM